MADFDNLLGDLEEETQPTLSPSDSVRDPDPNANANAQGIGADEGDYDDDEIDNEEGNVIPAALQEALLRQGNQFYDDTQTSTQEGDQDIYDDAEVEAGESEDYKALKQMWIHELNTTELCRYDEEFMGDLLAIMHHTEKDLEGLEKGDEGTDPTLKSIATHIFKMDIDRMSFLLADFMRVRLEKIERYALHNRDCHDLMSTSEVRVCKELHARIVVDLLSLSTSYSF